MKHADAECTFQSSGGSIKDLKTRALHLNRAENSRCQASMDTLDGCCSANFPAEFGGLKDQKKAPPRWNRTTFPPRNHGFEDHAPDHRCSFRHIQGRQESNPAPLPGAMQTGHMTLCPHSSVQSDNFCLFLVILARLLSEIIIRHCNQADLLKAKCPVCL